MLGYIFTAICGLIIGFFIGRIKFDRKIVEEKYTRRGLYKNEYSISIAGQSKGMVDATFEVGEVECTDTLSKVEVISIKTNRSEYNSDPYEQKKMAAMIDDSWIESSSIDYWRADELYDGRDYHLFNVLSAGVRGDGPSISEPRGVPDDASSAYRYIVDQMDGDGHSHSYFTLSELLEVDWKKYDAEYFTEIIEKMKKIDPDPDNVRCVFFFDN
jgi:hypothetical protein